MIAGLLASSSMAQTTTFILDPAKPGRTFEGIGGVSAGASSRLLIDYPEPQRSEILDYLFKPHYGASLQHLKVEIGGDVNSTDGVEPSHMHTRTDENYNRGYEWWLMKEAKKRNPGILLDCLAWGAPGWIGKGQYFSPDMANYVVKFIQGAKKIHGLEINYTGIANERYYDIGWIKLLRKTLDANGLERVGIVVADQSQPLMVPFPGPAGQKPPSLGVWDIAAAINQDPELKAAVSTIGVHYPFRFGTNQPLAAQASGLPLWASEDGPGSGSWLVGPTIQDPPLQARYNRNYVLGKMTKTEVWSPISSYYDNLPAPDSGLMKANTPWSGHYDINPGLWVTAHTTQFAQPGWKYLDSACQMLPAGGSCVGLMAPNGKDYSVIIETCFTRRPQTLRFVFTGHLSRSRLHVWRTNGRQQFQEIDDLPVDDLGGVQLAVEPNSIYSLTTTTGQTKGAAVSLPAASFPAHFNEDFSAYAPGSTPKYWSDFAGVFEVVKRNDSKGNALRQIIVKKGIEWCPNPFPESFCGDPDMANYSLTADALIEDSGFVSLFGRVARVDWGADPPQGYWLKVADTGDWELMAGKTKLTFGRLTFSAKTWHTLRLSFQEHNITVNIDKKKLATIEDSNFSQGNVGIGSGWNRAQFANIAIDSLPAPKHLVRAGPVANQNSLDFKNNSR